jgi:peptidoglycan/xylan/chitin deacetylase (PgdA/CDA1 family)
MKAERTRRGVFAVVPVLMYHEVAPRADIDALARKMQRGYILAVDEFERQMQWLAARGFRTVGLDALLAPDAGFDADRCVVLTFDDGYLGNFAHAAPILSRYGFTATFFVVSNKIGTAAMMRWSQLREMRASGLSVESHTANHPLLSTLDAPRTLSELTESKRRIEDELSAPVRFLSLPNGDSNPFYVAAAQTAGYEAGCCSEFGYNDAATDRWFLRRIAVKAGTSLDVFGRVAGRDLATLRAFERKAAVKRLITRTLGKRNYDRLYNWAFGVEEQDHSRRGALGS